jgi:PHD/YefM family antitoxin component YafN of YafNO toxin-antitoxin module
MKEYTYSEARQRFATVLDKAYREGAVRIKRRDGRVFIVRPEKKKSALEVTGLNLDMNRQEILDFILAGRKKTKQSSG